MSGIAATRIFLASSSRLLYAPPYMSNSANKSVSTTVSSLSVSFFDSAATVGGTAKNVFHLPVCANCRYNLRCIYGTQSTLSMYRETKISKRNNQLHSIVRSLLTAKFLNRRAVLPVVCNRVHMAPKNKSHMKYLFLHHLYI
jgi:hypothetical protein